MRRVYLIGFFLVASLALAGCTSPLRDSAAHKIADALPSTLGPASHYEVQVDGDPFALSRGRLRAVHIQGTDVQLTPSLTVDTFQADARDVSFSQATRRLTHVGQTDLILTIGQEHLSAYLGRAKPRPAGLSVTLRENNLSARVPVTFLGMKTSATLIGTLSPSDAEPGKLDFVDQSARFSIVPLPSALVNLALEILNPVIEFTGLRVPLTITQAVVVHHRLVLTGSADLNGLVQPESGIDLYNAWFTRTRGT